MAVGIASLSQEIISLVASYLQRWEYEDRANISKRGRALLPAYATISRSWQYAIERQTFREVAVQSIEIDEFSRIVVRHRRKLLRRLELNVVLPTYTDRACAKFETEKDKQSNNQVFTKAVKNLLALLRSWHDEYQSVRNDSDASIEQPLILSIGDCYSPTDHGYRDSENEWDFAHYHDLLQHRYESSLLQLESIEGTQEIPQISSFHVSKGTRKIEPRSLAMIATKFPNLNSFRWRLQDNEKRDPQLRQQTRFGRLLEHISSLRTLQHERWLTRSINLQDFAEALPMIPQGSLRQVAIDYFNKPPDNQELNASSALIPSLPTSDRLSLSIHAISLSERLTHLELGDSIVISPLLFWPSVQTKEPSWPNLVSVKVNFSMNTVDGDWYFTRDDNEDLESDDDDDAESDTSSSDTSESDDSDTKQNSDPDTPDTYNGKKVALAIGEEPYRHFRSRADPGKLNELFEAAARAGAHMPRLQRMTLRTEVKASRMFTFAMNYVAQGERTGQGAGSRNVDMPRLDWVIGSSGYEPEESILEIWRQAKGEVVQSVAEQ